MTPDKTEHPLAILLKNLGQHWTIDSERAWHEPYPPVTDRRKRRKTKEIAKKWKN
jgi:hypothetical protein